MNDKNEVIIRGRLGSAPKYSAGEGRNSRAGLSVCTNYTYTNKDGEKVTKEQWHNVVAWGKSADNASKFLVKGQQVEVVGRLETREYEVEGTTRRITEVIADRIDYGLKPKQAAAAETTAEPMVTKRQQTVVRKKASPQIELDIDADDPY